VPQGAGYLGSFTLGALADSTGGVDGSIPWTFSVADGALDFLAAGQILVQSYAVTIGDFHNGPATQIVTVTLTGTNDPTVILAAATTSSGSITEQAGATGSTVTDIATGSIAFTDADLTDTHRVVNVVPQGAGYLGSFTLGTLADSTGGVTGSIPWTFSVVDGALDFLATGQTLVQSYAVTIGDFHNGPATQIVTVTLTGTNDPTVIVAASTTANGSIAEQAGVTGSTTTDLASGSIAFTDADLTDTHRVVSVVPQGAAYLGSFTLGTLADSTGGVTGSIPWTFSVADGALDFLAAGQTLVQKYAVTIGDFHNGPATQIVTVTLTGTNDPTVILAAATTANGAITEQAGVTGSTVTDLATGTIAFTDADLTDAHRVVSVVPQGTGYLGSFTLGTLTDSTGGVTGSIPWTFSVVDGALDFLVAGQTLVQSYAVTIGDFHSGAATQIVTVTLTGTNDAPVIAGVSVSSVTEDVAVSAGNLVSSGILTIADLDLGESGFVTQAGTPGSSGLGTFTLNTAGHWTYAASNAQAAIQQLAAGQSVTDSFTATSLDGTGSQLVTVTLRGTNDPVVMTSTPTQASGSITEQAGTTASLALDTARGTIAFTDADLTDIHTVVSIVPHSANYLGRFTLGALSDSTGGVTGSVPWSFSVVDGALDFLPAGWTLVQSYDVTLGDWHGLASRAVQTVTVTLTGTNDLPVIGGVSSGAVTEDVAVNASGNLVTSGALTIADADLGQSGFVAQVGTAGSSGLGTFTLDAAGHWSYAASESQAAIQQLAAGQSVTDSFTAVSLDGTKSQLVTVTIHGTNDPVVMTSTAAQASGSITEQAGVTGSLALDTASGTVAFTDADLTDTHRVVSVLPQGSGYLGSFTLGAMSDSTGGVAGSIPWTFSVVDGALDFLAAGQTLVQSYAVTVGDFHNAPATQIVTVTLIGTNDAPVITSTIAAGVNEIGPPVTLTASFTDPDTRDSHIFAVDTTGTVGLVTNNQDGTFSYDPNGQFSRLAHGQTASDSFTYTVDDGHGGTASATATVTIFGPNSAPVAQAIAGNVNEDGPALALTASFSDADASDSHGFTVDTTGTVGLVTNNNDGTFSYDSNGKFASLAQGETATDSFHYTVDDGNGGSATQTATVTIIGENDAPVTQDIAGSANEHGPAITLTAEFSDPNASDTHTVTVDQSGTLGLVTEHVLAGEVTFSYDPNGQFASLAQGETATDSFTYTITDNHGLIATATATVTIIGQNDAPVANPDTLIAAAGTTTGDLSATLLANDTDVDTAHSALIITAVDTADTLGTVSLDPATHAVTYTAPETGGPDSFRYTISDGQGGTSTSTVTVNPDHLVTDNWLVSEGQTATFSADAVLTNDSAFDGGALTLVAVSGAHVSLNAGVITYRAPASDPSGLGDSFTYTTSDSLGRLATGTVNIALWDGSTTPVLGDPSIGSDANQAEWLIAAPATGPLTMTGTAAADHLTGGNGHAPGVNGGDTIIGGGGGDTLTGGLAFDHFVYNYGGPSAPNSDSHIGAMDTITDFAHLQGPLFQEVMELDGFGFSAAATASITAVTVATADHFTADDKGGYFNDGNVVHVEQAADGSAQVYVDANKSGGFEAASDLVIHLDHLAQGLVRSDFQFH
jgi:VCBS repeat-containing protein